jgi:hypothetical protein
MNIEDLIYSIDFAPWNDCMFNGEVDGITPQIQKQINANVKINFDQNYLLYLVSNNISDGTLTKINEIFDRVQFYCLQYEN